MSDQQAEIDRADATGDMTLLEAFEWVRGTHAADNTPSKRAPLAEARVAEASALLLAQLQQLVRSIRDVSQVQREDLVQNVFLKLYKRGGVPLEDASDARVRGYLKRALQNTVLDGHRRQKRQPRMTEDWSTLEEQNQLFSLSRGNPLGSMQMELGDLQRDSMLLRGLDTPEAITPRIDAFICETILVEAVSRRHARENARKSLAQMRALANDETDFDAIVAQIAGA